MHTYFRKVATFSPGLLLFFSRRVKIREVTLVQIILLDKQAHLTCYQRQTMPGSWIQDPLSRVHQDGAATHTLALALALAEGENITSIVIKSRRKLEERTKLTCSWLQKSRSLAGHEVQASCLLLLQPSCHPMDARESECDRGRQGSSAARWEKY